MQGTTAKSEIPAITIEKSIEKIKQTEILSGSAVEAAVQFFQFQSLVSKKSIDKFLF